MRRLVLALLLAAAPAAGSATADPAQQCLDVADAAADAAQIPRGVMRALTRTETGRTRGGALEPWPWTVNMEGAGHWFATRAEALAYVEREQARGARSFDVGCFQINHRWHGDAFASVDAMFEPMTNAAYAARFMAGLFAETGSWSKSAGFYHSRTPEFTARYRDRFDRILAASGTEPAIVLADTGSAASGTGESDAFPRFSAPQSFAGYTRAGPLRNRAGPLRAAVQPWRTVEAAPPTPGGVAVRLVRGTGGLIGRAPARPLIE